jgi:hypothetical protein
LKQKYRRTIIKNLEIYVNILEDMVYNKVYSIISLKFCYLINSVDAIHLENNKGASYYTTQKNIPEILKT